MRIEYELKFSDYLLFNVMHQFFSVPIQLLFIGYPAFIFYSSLGEHSVVVSAIGAILVYLAIWVVQLVFNVFYLCFGSYQALLTKHVVEIQDEAFYEETKFGRAYYFWLGLVKVISRPGFIAVYINANAAHILPTRAFSSPESRREFLSALKGKLKSA